MTDEGLLPNYAFPNGIILKAVLFRKIETADDGHEAKNASMKRWSLNTVEMPRQLLMNLHLIIIFMLMEKSFKSIR